MCLAVLVLDAHPRYPVVLAANRDEYYARESLPAAWGSDGAFAGVLAGRDLAAGGTWLGVHRNGRFAFVTNVRQGTARDPAARSRGELVPRVLGAADIEGAFGAIAAEGKSFNGFNLLAGDASGARWMSNRGEAARALAPGIHGLSNAALDTPWPKVVRTKAALAQWVERGSDDVLDLFAALADRRGAPDAALPETGVPIEWERVLASPFIATERYGTRCSTVVTLDRRRRIRFVERSFAPGGAVTGEVDETFDAEL